MTLSAIVLLYLKLMIFGLFFTILSFIMYYIYTDIVDHFKNKKNEKQLLLTGGPAEPLPLLYIPPFFKVNTKKFSYNTKMISKYFVKKKYMPLIEKEYFPAIKDRLKEFGVDCEICVWNGSKRQIQFVCNADRDLDKDDLEYISFIFQDLIDDHPEIGLRYDSYVNYNYTQQMWMPQT